MLEWLFAAYLGAAHTQRAALTFSQPGSARELTLPSVGFRGESWSSPLYYGYRIACFPTRRPWVGLEGEFTHLKVYANLPADAIVQRFSMSHGLNLVLANLVLRTTLRESAPGPLRLSGRLGAGPTVPHVESTIDGVSDDRYELGSVALHAAIGAEIPLRRRIGVFAEYKATRTRQHVDVAGGNARGVFVSHHAIVGLAWHSR